MMAKTKEKASRELLFDQQKALTHYLDDLLCGQETLNPTAEEEVELVEVPASSRLEPDIDVNGGNEGAEPLISGDSLATNSFPDSKVADYMFFKLAGLNLAIPMQELSGVENLEVDLRNPELGMRVAARELYGVMCKIMDITKVLLPPERLASAEHLRNRRFRQILLLNENRLGLVCEAVLGVSSVQSEAVRWRTEAGKRPWMAGMIPEQQAVLLDVSVLQQILQANG